MCRFRDETIPITSESKKKPCCIPASFECVFFTRVSALDDTTASAGDSSPTTQINGNANSNVNSNANSNANSNDNSLNNQDASPQNIVAPSKRVEELYDIPVGKSYLWIQSCTFLILINKSKAIHIQSIIFIDIDR